MFLLSGFEALASSYVVVFQPPFSLISFGFERCFPFPLRWK